MVADSLGGTPVVCLVGAPNAGKSALFSALTGEAALVSPIAGTTRDTLHGTLLPMAEQLGEPPLQQRSVRVVDTAGWLSEAAGLDAAALTAGANEAASATLIIACAAPDARLPDPLPIAQLSNQQIADQQILVIATKSDLGLAPDARAVLAVSATTGHGLPALHALINRLIAPVATAEPRQQRLLKRAAEALARGSQLLHGSADSDVLLADDLRQAAEDLGELLGPTTPDAVLDAIFQRFCIGK